MAFSLKKRVKSKLHIASGCDDDASVLGEALHRSTKTSKSKKKSKKNDDLLQPGQIYNPDSDAEILTPSSSMNPLITYRTACPCDSHYDKQLTEQNYDLTIDKLFDRMFGVNEFVRTYREAQRFYDDTATEWTMNEETKCRERVLNYKMPFESILVGKGTIITHEKQVLVHEVPGSHYIIESEVCNEGVRYSDTFSLLIRYCLVQTSFTTTNLRVTALVRFIRPVNSFVKQMIEKNAYSASQEALKDLNNRLNLISHFKIEKRRLSRGEVTLNVPSLGHEHARRLSRHDALASSISSLSLPNPNQSSDHSRSLHSDGITYYFIIVLGLLILFHLYLYLKLKHMDVLVENLYHLIRVSSSIASTTR